MAPLGENGTLGLVVDCCRASRDCCEPYLAQLNTEGRAEASARLAETTRCVALLSMIADRLELDGECPTEPIDVTIELARDLPDDSFGCAAACRTAADALSEWLDGAYQRG